MNFGKIRQFFRRESILRARGPVLVVSETASSTWHYHLRMCVPNVCAGDKLVALCGQPVGWDTNISPKLFLLEQGGPTWHPCSKCAAIASLDFLKLIS